MSSCSFFLISVVGLNRCCLDPYPVVLQRWSPSIVVEEVFNKKQQKGGGREFVHNNISSPPVSTTPLLWLPFNVLLLWNTETRLEWSILTLDLTNRLIKFVYFYGRKVWASKPILSKLFFSFLVKWNGNVFYMLLF